MSKVFLMLKNIYIKMMNYGWTLAYAKPTKQEGRRNVEYEANETLSWVRMDGWFNYWRYIYQLLWIAEVEKPFIYLLLIQYTSTLHRLIERAIEQYIYTSTSNLPHIHITSSDIRMAIVRWRLPCMIPTILILAITAATSSSFVFLDLDNDNDGHGWTKSSFVQAVAAAPCCYPALFVFGDSLSDTGNCYYSGNLVLCQRTNEYPYGETYPGAPSKRFSDGRLIVDFLGPSFHQEKKTLHNFYFVPLSTLWFFFFFFFFYWV